MEHDEHTLGAEDKLFDELLRDIFRKLDREWDMSAATRLLRSGASKALSRLARWIGPEVTVTYRPFEPRPLSSEPWEDREGNPMDPPPDCDEHPEKYGEPWLKGVFDRDGKPIDPPPEWLKRENPDWPGRTVKR